MPGKRRSWAGWVVFVGFILLNETRGLYMVAEFLKAYNSTVKEYKVNPEGTVLQPGSNYQPPAKKETGVPPAPPAWSSASLSFTCPDYSTCSPPADPRI